MKRLIVVGIMALALVGCAHASFETKDGTKVSYTRFLTTNDNIKAKVGDNTVEAGGQKIDATSIQTLLNLIATLSATPAK